MWLHTLYFVIILRQHSIVKKHLLNKYELNFELKVNAILWCMLVQTWSIIEVLQCDPMQYNNTSSLHNQFEIYQNI